MAEPVPQFFDQEIEPKPICGNCEYFDGGGLDTAGVPKNQVGDCLNKQSSNFVINASDTCRHFFPCSTRWPEADHG